MPITHAQIAPLLAGYYAGREAAWRALATIVKEKAFASAFARLARPGLGLAPADFARDVLADVACRAIEKGGLTPPPPPPPADYTAWLRRVATNAARDQLRKLEKLQRLHMELDPQRHLEEVAPEAEPASEAADLEVHLAALADGSPLWTIGLFAYIDPSRLDAALLTAAAAVPARGRAGTTTGIARDVAATLALLAEHRAEIAPGASRNKDARERLAWILRSDSPDFAAWRAEGRTLKAACETLAKWSGRARERLAEARRGAAPEEDG